MTFIGFTFRERRTRNLGFRGGGDFRMSKSLTISDESPEQLLLSNLPLLRSIVRAAAKRWRLRPEDEEDLLSEVQLKLLDHDGQALRSCQGTATLRPFLATTVARHLLDRRNHEWGKWRPCAEAKRQGPDAEELDRLLHRDGRTMDEAVALLRQRGVPWDREEIERRAALFPARVRRRQETDEGLDRQASPTASPEQAVLASERAEQRDRALQRIGEEVSSWPPEDVLVLRAWMRGEAVTSIARQLEIPQRALYWRFEVLFKRLRKSLEQVGIGLAEAREILSLARWESELTDRVTDSEKSAGLPV